MANTPRFQCWAGTGIPKGWSLNMGLTGEDVGDVVWPIVDNETSGPIDGFPRPDQMLCWCPTAQKQAQVATLLCNASTMATEVQETINENLHLADGTDCTLRRLVRLFPEC